MQLSDLTSTYVWFVTVQIENEKRSGVYLSFLMSFRQLYTFTIWPTDLWIWFFMSFVMRSKFLSKQPSSAINVSWFFPQNICSIYFSPWSKFLSNIIGFSRLQINSTPYGNFANFHTTIFNQIYLDWKSFDFSFKSARPSYFKSNTGRFMDHLVVFSVDITTIPWATRWKLY